jgi:hypothetical protein
MLDITYPITYHTRACAAGLMSGSGGFMVCLEGTGH